MSPEFSSLGVEGELGKSARLNQLIPTAVPHQLKLANSAISRNIIKVIITFSHKLSYDWTKIKCYTGELK